MIKQIKFFTTNIFKKFLEAIISHIIFRNKKIILLALRTPNVKIIKKTKDYFMHNTKYLSLYLNDNKNSGFKFIYLCDDNKMNKKFKSIGIKNVYKRKSLKGLYYSLIAKYWLFDDGKFGINTPILSAGAVCINLWHGIPLKKIGYDITGNYEKYNKYKKLIFNILRDKDNFYIVNSEYEQACYERAFLTEKENIKILGSPRLDVLLHDIEHSDLFMEEDFKNIKRFKKEGKKLFFYTPTFRDTGKDISSWLQSQKLKEFLKANNSILVCKLHFADKNSLNFDLPEEFYKMESDADIYPVLKYSDALITDYSSIYFDYLLLNKPILYYVPDIEEYQEKCRGFYKPYSELTAGEITKTEDELFKAMNNVINKIDEYIEQRKKLRNELFKFQDGKNCERVVNWIKSLDK